MLHRSSTLFAVLWAGLLLVTWLMVGVIEVMLHMVAPHTDAWVLGLMVAIGLGLVLLPGKTLADFLLACGRHRSVARWRGGRGTVRLDLAFLQSFSSVRHSSPA